MSHAETATTTRRVLVVDDHRILADLVAGALDAASDLECVGVAEDGPRALTIARATRPDTVLLDVQLPSSDGVALVDELHDLLPGVRVILLTGHPRPDLERRALAAGAVGFLGKDGRLTELLDAVRHASPTRPARDPRLAARAELADQAWTLTPRELEVLGLLGEGFDVAAIATSLELSTYTVRDYVKAVLAKLGVRSQLEAVTAAGRAGLISVGGR